MLEPQEKSKLGASITSIIQYNINKSLKFIYNNVDRYLKFNSMVYQYQYIFRTSLEYWMRFLNDHTMNLPWLDAIPVSLDLV